MAQEGASPATGVSPRAAQGLSLVGPDGTQGRGVKRPRADTAARAASTGRPGQGAQHVDTVRGHAAHIPASQPAAAQVKSASILSRDAAGERCSTKRLSSASEQPAASVQLGSNLRLADGGTAGSARQDDSSTPADLTHAANSAVEAAPAQQARSAPPKGSPAAGSDSPVQAASALQDHSPQPASALRDDSPQAAKPTQLKVLASKKALSDLQEKHLDGEQDTRQGTPPLRDGSPGGFQLDGSQAKRGRSEATLDVSMPGAEQNAGTDVAVSRVATPLRGKSVGVDDTAPPSSKTQDAIVESPPFTDVDGNSDAYEVDRIVDHRSWNAGSTVRVQYLVRWKGYGPEYDTWQTKTSLRHAREAVQDYHNCTQ